MTADIDTAIATTPEESGALFRHPDSKGIVGPARP
jgi:hypothetical protein